MGIDHVYAAAGDLSELILTATPTASIGSNITYSVNYKNISSQELKNSRVSTSVQVGANYVTDSATQNGTYCEDRVIWDLPTIAPGANFEASFAAKVLATGETKTHGPACPASNIVLMATVEKTGIQNENGQNPDYGIKDLGGGQEVTIVDTNKMDINISPSVDYRANFSLIGKDRFAFDHDYISASKSIDQMKIVLDKISGSNSGNGFLIKDPATALSSGIVVALYNDLSDTDKNDVIKTALGINNDGDYPQEFEEAYYIKTADNRVLIAANSHYGLSHGIEVFLRSFGYRLFFMEGDREYGGDLRMASLASIGKSKNWEIIPPVSAKITAMIHIKDRPYFKGRYISMAGTDWVWSTPTALEDFNSWYRALLSSHLTNTPGHRYQALWSNTLYNEGEFAGRRGYEIFNTNLNKPNPSDNFILGFDSTHFPERFDHHAYTSKKFPYPSVDTYGTICTQYEVEDGACKEIYKPNFSNEKVRELWVQLEKQAIDSLLPASWNPDSAQIIAVVSLAASDGDNWNLSTITDPMARSWYENWYNSLPESVEKNKFSAENWNGLNRSDWAYGISNYVHYRLSEIYQSEISTGELKIEYSTLAYSHQSQPPNFKLYEDIDIIIKSEYCGYPECGPGNVALYNKWALAHGQPNRKFSLSYFFNIKEFGRDYQPSIIPTTKEGFKSYFVDNLASIGLNGLSANTQSSMGLNGLNFNLLAFGMWNPKINFDYLKQDFLDKSFGNNGTTTDCSDSSSSIRGCMRQYFDVISIDNLKIVNSNHIAKALNLLDKSYSLAKAQSDSDPTNIEKLKIVYRINDFKINWYHMYLVQQLRYFPENNRGSIVDQFFNQLFFRQGKSYMASWEALGFIMNPDPLVKDNGFQFIHNDALPDTSELGSYWNVNTIPQRWTGNECSQP